MTTNLFAFDDTPFFDPFSPVNDSSDHTIDTILHSSPQKTSHENDFDEFASLLFNPQSPPNDQMGQLSLSQNRLPESAMNSVDSESNPCLGVETEKSFTPFHPGFGYVPTFVQNGNYGRGENGVKISFNNPCFDEQKPSFLFQSHFNGFMDSPNVYGRRGACITGGIQSIQTMQMTQKTSFSSPVAAERSFMQKPNPPKVVKYSSEHRKESIQRYKAKRPLRNFNKTIQYACRKTLADSRPRIRGRFARHDETEETGTCNRHEHMDDISYD